MRVRMASLRLSWAISIFLAVVLWRAWPALAGWDIETVDSTGWVGYSTSIALDASDNPHISYFYESKYDLKYASFNGSNWDIETVDSTGWVGAYTSLALDADDYPHISYYDLANKDLKYATFNGSNWDIETVDSTVGGDTSLALDADDYPHISYYGNSDLKYASFNGSTWDIEIVTSTSIDTGTQTSLALNADGHAHISFSNFPNYDLKYASFNGSTWDIETVDSTGLVASQRSLALDANDYPHISYHDATNEDLKYASYNGSTWDIEIVDSTGNVGRSTSLVLDASGYAHISYYDFTNRNLKYATFNGSTWDIETVDSNGQVGAETSIAIDANDNPHISYLDVSNEDLKYAFAYGGYVTCTDNDNDGYAVEGGDCGPVDCNDNNENIFPGAAELCNGIDDDCNSVTPDGSDEAWYLQPTSCGTGQCASAGQLVCQGGQQVDTCTPGTPTGEVCDGLDNDCDTIIDNGGDALCDDEFWCNGQETCGGVSGCQSGTPVDCSDGVDCTDDLCDEINDQCLYTPNDGYCAVDGWFDTGNIQWVSSDQCTEKEQKEQEYRDHYCDVTLDCQYTVTGTQWVDTASTRPIPNGTGCDDGDPFTINDMCIDGVCSGQPDSDLDGILDDGDNSEVIGDNPCTGGQTADCDDNCLLTLNPAQSDIDEDWAGDLCDICPNDALDLCDPDGSTAQEIDPNEGGTIQTPNGELVIVIEPNDLSDGVTISITKILPTDPNADLMIGPSKGKGKAVAVYDLQPDGQVFDEPVTLTITADVTGLKPNQRDRLGLYLWDDILEKFVLLETADCSIVEDPPGTFIKTCTVELEHFSIYAVILSTDWETRAYGDFTADRWIDMEDLFIMVQDWLQTDSIADIAPPPDGDNTVNDRDFGIMALHWLDYIPEGMVYIPQGEFEMGDHFTEGNPEERPVHAVLLDAFLMSKYEITNQQYCDYLNDANSLGLIEVRSGVVYASPVGTDPYCDTHSYDADSQIDYLGGVFSVRDKGGRDMSDDPMVQVSWYGSVAYCNWRSSEGGYEACYNLSTWDPNFSKNGYRLATEAEWEYAARGGLSGKRFPWNDPNISHSVANYNADPCSWSYDVSPTSGYHPDWDDVIPYTSVVGSFSANGFDLYDMTGNVWEWCNDWYDLDYYDTSPYDNPIGPASGSGRVLRGGGWGSDAKRCRVAGRYDYPGLRHFNIGFRIVLSD